MKRPILYYNILIALSLVFAVLFTFFSAREYRLEMPNDSHLAEDEIVFSLDNDNVGITEFKADNDTVSCLATPVREGTDFLELTPKNAEDSHDFGFGGVRFYCGPFNTIFVMDPMLNFNGSGVVIAVIFFDIFFTAVFMTAMYVFYLRRAAFSYGMVACGGIALFTIIILASRLTFDLVSGNGWIGSLFSESFGLFLADFVFYGNLFALHSAPFMAAFSVTVTVSNLVLIRREGFRIVNLLGAILGVLWIFGMTVSLYFDFNSSGSAERGSVFTSISSGVAVIISYFVCMLFSTVVSAWLASRRRPPYDRDYIVILGCSIRSDGTLTPLLRGRVDAALEFAREQLEKTGRSVRFVPSGGQGGDEVISESEAMKRYLLEQGVPENQILTEDRSVNTDQNVRFSKEVIEADAGGEYNTAVATTNYHVFRSYILAQKAGLKNMRGISAKTKWYFFPNAFLRELAGLIVDKKRLHIFMVLLLTISFVLINLFLWYS